jgi:GR25 family glycosyltransferase involved in LPS biosynthesis
MKFKLTDIPVVYINLDEHTERRDSIQSSLEDLGFKNIIRVSGFKDPIGKRGCAYSHALALEEIDPPFILLEDDCLPLNFIDEIEVTDESDAV